VEHSEKPVKNRRFLGGTFSFGIGGGSETLRDRKCPWDFSFERSLSI